ncbi:unnamed protein product [Heterosigma akashiwo]
MMNRTGLLIIILSIFLSGVHAYKSNLGSRHSTSLSQDRKFFPFMKETGRSFDSAQGGTMTASFRMMMASNDDDAEKKEVGKKGQSDQLSYAVLFLLAVSVGHVIYHRADYGF